MDCDAVVNTANEYPTVGRGCDTAIYHAAGYDQLLSYRREHIGRIHEGEVFLTPGFDLKARYIIHAVSPAYHGGNKGEEKKLRSCYQKSLELACREGFRSIAFPLIATGSFRYPKEDGMRIAVDEINAFLLKNNMLVYLVVYDEKSTELGRQIYPGLRSYLDRNYVPEETHEQGTLFMDSNDGFEREEVRREGFQSEGFKGGEFKRERFKSEGFKREELQHEELKSEAFKREEFQHIEFQSNIEDTSRINIRKPETPMASMPRREAAPPPDFYDHHESKLAERMKHLEDTFSEYLMFLIKSKGMKNSDVYHRAIVDKKVFSKIKNNRNAHPQKMTALCLCIGAQLNIDEARDLLARAGYALSPSDRTDVIFSYFIENEIYDMIQLDIELEEYGEHCLIS